MRQFLPMLRRLVLSLAVLTCGATGRADDWPMWRCDPERSAASNEQLPERLSLQWVRREAPRRQAWDDPLNLDLMTYDRVFEPIVLGDRLLVGFNDRDQLAAFHVATGEELWTVYAEAPVRLPPAGWKDRVCFCSDDGFLYCVNVADGSLLWKFQGAPGAAHSIGNQRLTSAWPARGGPVIRDGIVYFAASIWPMMGTFLYALDVETGQVLWVNDRTGSQFIKQPHSALSFAGVAPQGALVATNELLIVPGGRSVPAVFDRRDGQFRHFEINAGGKGTGGSFVAADDDFFYVHTRLKGTRAFQLDTGVKTGFQPNEPVLFESHVYSADIAKDARVIRAYGPDQQVLWQVSADGRGDLIRAGNCLYAAGDRQLTAIRLPDGARPAQVLWSLPSHGRIERLVAANGRLFAVTLEGEIHAYGKAPGDENASVLTRGIETLTIPEAARQSARELLEPAEAAGFAFWFGAATDESIRLVEALATVSPFVQLAVVESDPGQVETLRTRLDRAGLYGRLTVHHAAPLGFRAPPYVANMIFVAPEHAAEANGELISHLYQSVRPYGGVLYLLTDANRETLLSRVAALGLEQAEVETAKHGVVIRRVGALPGSADWTHQYGDVANTIKSDDRRVKLPLGVLWFGGSSHMDVLPRHGHGPPEQVVGGRLFIQGINLLSARDVYTGRILWQRKFEDLGTYDVYYDETYRDTPLDPSYNQVHIPGANGRGTNYVVTEDAVYLVEGSICHVLDPATGETLRDIALPESGEGDKQWGYIGVYEDVLIGGLGFAMYRGRNGLSFESDQELSRSKKGFGSKSYDRAASMALVGFDRHTGQLLWKVPARHSFWHNGIVAGGGKVYCLDRLPQPVESALRRLGRTKPESYRILAFDCLNGETCWEVQDGVFGTWLGYSDSHDLLLQAGAAGSDRLKAEVGSGMAVYEADTGRVRWKKDNLKYAGPCILHHDWIITNANSYAESAGAFHLETGEQKLVPNPLTGELQPWTLSRTYGCNNIIASENLLTFRSGAAGFYDLLNDSGTGNFGGFKSGCTSNLVVANGVLNAPDYTRTCSCAYQNQTSLALVHMPDVEVWTVNPAAAAAFQGDWVQQLGLNFGAPGDRRDAQGQLWLEYPAVGGPSAEIDVEFDRQPRAFRQHSARANLSSLGGAPAWVLASGVAGMEQIRIRLRLTDDSRSPSERLYRVRLVFGTPPADAPGPHVFDVRVQGQHLHEGVRIDGRSQSAETRSTHTRTQTRVVFDEVAVQNVLHIELVPHQGTPMLSGLQLELESAGPPAAKTSSP